MDTPTAISTLTAMLATVNGSVSGLQAQAQAIQVALDQLNDILNTPAADLAQAQAEIATLQATEAASLSQDTQVTPPIS